MTTTSQGSGQNTDGGDSSDLENEDLKKAQDNPPTHEEDPFVPIGEVARQLGVHRNTVHRWINDGLLEAVKRPSELVSVRKSQINKFLGGSALTKQVK